MNRTKLKNYAPQARRDFIQAVTDRAAVFGLTKTTTEPITQKGDVAIIGGRNFPTAIADKRRRLEERINRLTSAGKTPAEAFGQVMEAIAYTWFNRLVAIRYMEIHGYLDHGFRVLSHKDPAKATPEILEHAESVVLPGLDTEKVINLKLDGTKEPELYRMLLIAQCNALSSAMPFLFERIDDETELLLPDNLLNSDSLIRKLVTEIDEEDWQEVEIIGWLYQFYISEKKDEVIGKVVKSEDIPAATQLFTPNWIVKYLVQNSLGRKWLSTYPASPLRQKMAFYIEPAEQTAEVKAQLAASTPTSLNPEELTMMDPACGSGHILVEGYDLLKEIYLERGYRLRDIPKLILTKNLFGLDIDDRAAQLAAFALMMKGRADDRRLFDTAVPTNVLAIQESNGLNVNAIVQAFTEKKITNSGDLEAGEFGFMESVRSPLFARNRTSATVGDALAADLTSLFLLFENAKTFGTLIAVPHDVADRLPALLGMIGVQVGLDLQGHNARRIATLFALQASLLARRYTAVVTNPPYMGRGGFNPLLKSFVEQNFPASKADLYASFIERVSSLCQPRGYGALITIPSWMFLATFEQLREWFYSACHVTSLLQNGRGVWGSDFGTCAFVFCTTAAPDYEASYRRLFQVQGSVATNEELQRRFHTTKTHVAPIRAFQHIPGRPVAYWAGPSVIEAFRTGVPFSQIAEVQPGLQTSDNARFVRMWWEVGFDRIGFNCATSTEAVASGRKWFPYNKGGDYRLWYGNNTHVVNWQNNGHEIKAYVTAKYPYLKGNIDYVVKDRGRYFAPSITWSKVSVSFFGIRQSPAGFLFDVAGSSAFPKAGWMGLLTGFLGSAVAVHLMDILNPTLNKQTGNVADLPLLPNAIQARSKEITGLVAEAISLSRDDWDSVERSWEFRRHPSFETTELTLAASMSQCSELRQARRSRLQTVEQQNNGLWVDLYCLSGEVSTELPNEAVTVLEPDVTREVGALCGYALGCAMGRYSLDKPGLIYANSGNDGFDASQYKTFAADADGIIPITEIDWFEDAAARRFEQFVAVAWPKEHLEENLKFVAESLGAKGSEQPRDTIRRYFADDFYKDHLQTYKRRPIYWMFTSGRLGAFQCLVYLHRYNEGTLARMRTEYVIPLQGKINARIDQLEGDKNKAAPTHKKRLEKEQQLLKKQQAELIKFDEKLRHYADMRIDLDLDDGVKVNYGKFGDLLANVTQVCGKTEDDDE